MATLLVGTRVIVSNFVDGTRVVGLKPRETEADALARAQLLENRGQREQADKYLDDYIRRTSVTTHH
jgi:hypothetical protein